MAVARHWQISHTVTNFTFLTLFVFLLFISVYCFTICYSVWFVFNVYKASQYIFVKASLIIYLIIYFIALQ